MLQIHPALLNFKRPSDHSTYSPSAAERWMGCPASIRQSKDIPQEDSIYSREGTLAHSVCEAQFNLDMFAIDFPSQLLMDLTMWDRTNGSGSVEMYDGARIYVDVVSMWLQNKELIGDVVWYGLERGVPIFPEKGCFGTGDCIIVGTKGCVIIDYKYGKGKAVKADTLQLRVYAAGIIRHLINIPQDYKVFTVVVQPRIYAAPAIHEYSVGEITQFLGAIWKAIIACEDPNAQAKEDPGHCFWCPARRTTDRSKKCTQIMDRPIKAAHQNFEKYLADMNAPIDNLGAPNPKRDEAMMKIIALMPLLEQIKEDALEEFKHRLIEGESIPGLQLVDVFGRRELAGDPEHVAQTLKAKFPKLDPFKIVPEKKVLKTITEIEKEVGKNALDTLAQRKVTKDIKILDDKTREVLGKLAEYGNMNPKEIA